MKEKGFTLVEILAVVVILGILIGIATPVYFRLSGNVRSNELSTKLNYLEERAIKYAEEQAVEGSKIISVSTLVATGYVVADKYVENSEENIPFIINPTDTEDNLACRLVKIDMDGYEYNAEISEDSDCDIVSQNAKIADMGIALYPITASNKIGSNKIQLEVEGGTVFNWTKDNVALVVTPSERDAKVTISNAGNTKTSGNNMLTGNPVGKGTNYDNVMVISAVSILQTNVNVSVQKSNSLLETVVTVRIDKEEPIVSSVSFDGWSTSKKLTSYVSDGNGSGPAGIYLSSSKSIPSSDQMIRNNNNGVFIVDRNLDNGTYYLWAEDKVGNRTSTYKEVYVTNVDNDEPYCIYPDGAVYSGKDKKFISNPSTIQGLDSQYINHFITHNTSGWTNSPLTIRWGCWDSESGCKDGYNGGTKTFINQTTQTYNLPAYTISDNSGRTTQCPSRTIKIYHDSIAPNCPVTGENTRWTSDPVTIHWGCDDSDLDKDKNVQIAGSGCKVGRSGGVTTYQGGVGTSYKTMVISSYDVEDNLGNARTCFPGGKTVNVYYDHKLPNISPKVSPLTRNSQSYNLLDNVNYSDDDSGISKVYCTPANTSEKGNSGTYEVNCYAEDNAVDSSGNAKHNVGHTAFTVKHQYPATYHPKTCTRCAEMGTCSDCDDWDDCCSQCVGGAWCCPPDYCWGYCCNGSYCAGPCCNRSHEYDCCKRDEDYDCSYYTCDIDTSQVYLSGSTCYYR